MSRPELTYDVVVIGAGIVGAACAYFLTREGLRVAVLEKVTAGGGGGWVSFFHRGALSAPFSAELSMPCWK